MDYSEIKVCYNWQRGEYLLTLCNAIHCLAEQWVEFIDYVLEHTCTHGCNQHDFFVVVYLQNTIGPVEISQLWMRSEN